MSLKKVSGAISIFIFIILFGGIVYTSLEGWSFLDSIYFSAVTITTLGYGDFVPITTYGKLFTILFSISGIAIGLYILTVIGQSFFTLELKKWGSKKSTTLKKNKSFNIVKMAIGDNITWKINPKEVDSGNIVEIGLEHIKIQITKKNGELVHKREQKMMIITSKGKLRKIK